ncbi:MAG: TIGR03668 family PPOX class F420-dependent oxidoreductase [Acidimicrobiia bacterium]|nr:TIGR03668 family PPOX class F420-dependent oxidoreductase [Acidimicrobiia bacterium]MDH5421010.1 TIGR03668 family PPOX class F420-dependent oxidoreductase [Acidimicrobiia bacterium]MDH5503941.1 TIGR03668 family PPOX class F420-dependent oxidoreductase [Acidimicrobiia bacterium]
MPLAKLAQARFGTLSSVRPDGRPHAVPIVFVIVAGKLVTAIDHKPKTTSRLVRLANIDANPNVSILVSNQDEAWDQLWWVRADGTAEIQGEPEPDWIKALIAKYPQYRGRPPGGPWIVVSISHLADWSYT